MIEGIRQFHAAYPDFRITMNETVFGKNIAFTQWTVTGTATSDDGSTNKITIEGATMMRVVDGQITEEWVYFDSAQSAKPSGEVAMKHVKKLNRRLQAQDLLRAIEIRAPSEGSGFFRWRGRGY
jgi:hypothetical protein